MPSHEQCRTELMEAFEQGAKTKSISPEARAWLVQFCDDWIPNPPNAGGRSIAELWDDENGGPPANGQKLKSRFKKIGRVAADKCDEVDSDEITDTEVEAATQEVANEPASVCPFCPDM